MFWHGTNTFPVTVTLVKHVGPVGACCCCLPMLPKQMEYMNIEATTCFSLKKTSLESFKRKVFCFCISHWWKHW